MPFRIRAFIWHLVASLALAAVAVFVVFGIWYPYPLHQAVGLTVIFLLLLGIDIVLGPILTLLVAKQGKRTLKLDLGVIITIQLTAFAYGMYVVAEGRPVWLVLNNHQVDLIQAFEVDNLYLSDALPEYQKLGWQGPKWVAVREPADEASREVLKMETVFAGVDLSVRSDLYVSFAEEVYRIRENARDVNELFQFNDRNKVEKILKKWPEADGYIPMTAFIRYMTILVKRESGEIIAIVNLEPQATQMFEGGH